MENIYSELKLFLMVFTRVSIILFMMPFFNLRTAPPILKAGLSLILSIIIYFSINKNKISIPLDNIEFIFSIIKEIFIGFIISLTIILFFEAIRIAGQYMGFQIGFSITNILDPYYGNQQSILASFIYFTAFVLFLCLNGHHILLKSLVDSFYILSFGNLNVGKGIFDLVLYYSSEMFRISIKIASPVLGMILLTHIIFAIITRVIPQMNIMIVAFPIQIIIGLIFFGLSFHILSRFMEVYTINVQKIIYDTLNIINKGS